VTDDANQPRPSNPVEKINMGNPESQSVFQPPRPQPFDGLAEYKARQDAERAKMAKFREMRLAAEAKAGKAEGKAKRKPTGKTKR
jgi:hypothetical protein